VVSKVFNILYIDFLIDYVLTYTSKVIIYFLINGKVISDPLGYVTNKRTLIYFFCVV